MGGRGPRYAPGTEILDPLMAQALVLEDAEGNRALWISLDLIGFSYARSADSAVYDWQQSRVYLTMPSC